MILLCDEDIGTKVPRALAIMGYEAHSLVEMGWVSKPDVWVVAKSWGTGLARL